MKHQIACREHLKKRWKMSVDCSVEGKFIFGGTETARNQLPLSSETPPMCQAARSGGQAPRDTGNVRGCDQTSYIQVGFFLGFVMIHVFSQQTHIYTEFIISNNVINKCFQTRSFFVSYHHIHFFFYRMDMFPTRDDHGVRAKSPVSRGLRLEPGQRHRWTSQHCTETPQFFRKRLWIKTPS